MSSPTVCVTLLAFDNGRTRSRDRTSEVWNCAGHSPTYKDRKEVRDSDMEKREDGIDDNYIRDRISDRR